MFDELKLNLPETKYYVEYHEESGTLLKIFSSNAFSFPKNYVEIPVETAEGIETGKIKSKDLAVDVINKKLLYNGVGKTQAQFYKIPLTDFSNITTPDIYLSFINSELSIELTTRFGGTHGETTSTIVNCPDNIVLYFFITKYNDPTTVFEIINLKVADLKNKCYNIKLDLESFSVFTNRIFNEYVLDL